MWVVCGRNVALGVYATMESAVKSIHSEGYHTNDPTDGFSTWHRAGYSELTLIRLTQDTPHAAATPLFGS